MKMRGNVEVPQSAFLAVLKMDEKLFYLLLYFIKSADLLTCKN